MNNPHVPLRMAEADPERLLSPSARARINKAYIDGELMRHRALAAADFACGQSTRVEEFLLRSPEYRDAMLESVRLALVVVWQEFSALGLPRRQLMSIMRARINEDLNSLSRTEFPCSSLDRRTFEIELTTWAAAQNPALSETAGMQAHEQAPKELSHEDYIRRLEEFKVRSGLAWKQIAERSGINDESALRKARNGKFAAKTHQLKLYAFIRSIENMIPSRA